ncbi:MAG TPA: universal stress protein [Terriglobales bacterium]|nr:universal stress protein [Terriglobales bacterium]
MDFFETGSYVAFPKTRASATVTAVELPPRNGRPVGVVLALPRSLPQAAAIAKAMRLPADIFVVRTSGIDGKMESNFTGLLQELEIDHPELRILEMHKRTKVGRWLQGSVTEALFRKRGWPVLVLRPHTFEMSAPQIHNILYATDLSTESLHALRYASTIAKENSAKLYVLHVETAEEGDPFEQQVALRWLGDWVEGQALDHGETFLRGARCLARFGNPAQKILETAAELQSDMIVLGARGRGMMPGEDHFVGKTAYEVACSSYSPLLIVPERAEMLSEPELVMSSGLA